MGNDKYTDGFRRETADCVISTGRPITEVAKELGLNDKTVNDWVLRHKRSQGSAPGPKAEDRELARRRGYVAEGPSSTATAAAYTSRLPASWARENDVGASCGHTGSCHDDAVAESFLATPKNEMYYRRSFATREEARFAVIGFIGSSTTAGAPTRRSATGCRPT